MLIISDAIGGETMHPSGEETEIKGGEYPGKVHSLKIDSADSGIPIEEAKQEEGVWLGNTTCLVVDTTCSELSSP